MSTRRTRKSLPKAISDQLQNPATEADRIAAWAELKDYMLTYPLDEDARNLYDKYRTLDRDWTTQVKSGPGA